MVLWAYIDPSTGSLVFQVVAASILSAGLFFKSVRDRIIWLITRGWRKRRSDDVTAPLDANHKPASAGESDQPARKAA